ncbi:hypothetical protein OAK81_02360, partial [Verrucomicrobiales bacterium]|nr:hypothetical protein [Verrucomicrobiales bacterium]
EETPEKTAETKNVEISITEKTILVNGELLPLGNLKTKISQLLAGKESDSDRVILVKTADDATYQRWIDVTSAIESAGGIITIQMEQEEVQIVN